jgi:histidyl-tRNA synthetase
MARYQRVIQAFRETSAAYGYGEIRTPTIEYLHLFTAAGTLSPRMLSRVYSFLDWDGWSGERVVLRPDATIPAVRFYTENFAPGQVAKLSYVENVFRFADGDESREDWQCGLEVIGDTAPLGDIELIHIAMSVLESAGVPDLEVRISNAGLVRAVLSKTGLTPEQQSELNDRILDGDANVVDEIERSLPSGDSPLRLLLEMEGNTSSFLTNLAEIYARNLPELGGPLAQLAPIVDTLERLGYRQRISAMLVRNFEYYTGPVFQLWSGNVQVGAGGRYDDLVELTSGSSVPASGLALDLESVCAAMHDGQRSNGQQSVLIEPSSESSETVAAAFRIAGRLQATGWRTLVRQAGGEMSEAPWVLTIDGSDGQINYRLNDVASGSWRVFRDQESLVEALDGVRL